MTTEWNRRTLLFLAVTAVVFLMAGLLIGGSCTAPNSTSGVHADHDHDRSQVEKPEVWTCSMHPQIKQPEPGDCPICGMDLIPLEDAPADDQQDRPVIELSENARKLARVQTVQVKTNEPQAEKNVTGEVVWNQALQKTESSWFGGRIDKLNVLYEGQYVRQGQVIAELYSPELYGIAEEYKQASESENQLLLNSVQKKLELLGLNEELMQQYSTGSSGKIVQSAQHNGYVTEVLVKQGEYVQTGAPLYQLNSGYSLWVHLQIFEQDVAAVQKKQKVSFNTPALPGKTFVGRVEFIDPQLDPSTRTVTARVSVKNKSGLLKPGMLVQAKLQFAGDRQGLFIPETAPLITGRRAVVYVEDSTGVYSGRIVKLGALREGWYEVLEGLQGDEIVVKRGAFKIDAAMQIQAYPSMMYPQGGVTGAGHDHGQHDEKNKIQHKIKPVNQPQKAAKSLKNENNAPGAKEEKWFDEAYAIYLQVQQALGGDQAEEVARYLQQYSKHLHSVPQAMDDGHAHHLAATLEKAASEQDIRDMRKEFIGVSNSMISWIDTFGFTPSQGAAVYHCPMADNNNGARWLQSGGGVYNPYFGSAMLRCGSKEKVYSPEAGS